MVSAKCCAEESGRFLLQKMWSRIRPTGSRSHRNQFPQEMCEHESRQRCITVFCKVNISDIKQLGYFKPGEKVSFSLDGFMWRPSEMTSSAFCLGQWTLGVRVMLGAEREQSSSALWCCLWWVHCLLWEAQTCAHCWAVLAVWTQRFPFAGGLCTSLSITFFLPFFLDPDLRLKTPFFPSSTPWLTWWICTTNAMSSVEWWRCRKENWISQRCVELLLITAVRKFWPLCAAIDRVIRLLPLPLCAHNTSGMAKSFGRGVQLPPGNFLGGWVANCPCACTLHVENTSSGCWEKKKTTHPCLTQGTWSSPGAPAWPSGPCPRLVLRPALHMHAPHHHLQMQWEETRSDESLGTGKAYDKHKN